MTSIKIGIGDTGPIFTQYQIDTKSRGVQYRTPLVNMNTTPKY